MKHLYLLLILSFFYGSASAQGENNIWAFGYGSGLDFSTGSPRAYGSALYTVEGSASVCGKNGNLKFYSDGAKAFNRLHKVMPNGSGLLTDLSITQGVVIVPAVGDTNRYYLFVICSEGNLQTSYLLNYSVIDMRLDGGNGDIVPGLKNIRIDSILSEKMFVTRAEGCNYWVMVHGSRKPEFHAYKITADGVQTTPVVSTTSFTGDGQFWIGEMKVAQANDKIVLANWRSKGTLGSIELFDFDSTSGKVGNYRLVDSSSRYAAYGIEFSPNGKMIYAGFGEDDPRPPYPLVQYNIGLLPDIAMVLATKTVLGTAYNWGGMRRHKGKIYVIRAPGNICVINDPDKAGTACNFSGDNILGATTFKTGYSLGNPVPETQPHISRVKDTTICTAITYEGAAGFQHYTWSDGSTAASHTVTAPASVWVKADNGNCGAETIDTFHVRKKELAVDLGPSFMVSCKEDKILLDTRLPDADYRWNTGSTTSSLAVTESGSYQVTVQQGDCIASDSVYVRLDDCDPCVGFPTAFTPNQDGRNDVFRAIASCPVLEYSLKIFNRYGEQVFGSDNTATGWDGTFNGQPQELGVYFYLVKVRFDKQYSKEELYKGDVSLLR